MTPGAPGKACDSLAADDVPLPCGGRGKFSLKCANKTYRLPASNLPDTPGVVAGRGRALPAYDHVPAHLLNGMRH